MRRVCLNAVHELAQSDERVFFIGSDLGHGVLDDFRRDIPDRFFMEGVSEANVIGMSAGLALEGNIPFVNTIATFLTRRAFEQIAVDLCLHNANVRLIGNGGGVVYAAQGPTHMAVEDIAIMRALPNMTVLAPCDAHEMAELMPHTLDWQGPIYIRLARGGDRVVTEHAAPFAIGKARKLREGAEVLMVTTGIGAQRALDAAEDLEKDGVNATVLHMPTVKPFDVEALLEAAEDARVVVAIEEHIPSGGLSSLVAETLMEMNDDFPRKFARMTLPDKFPDDYGSQQDLLDKFGLTFERTAATVRALLNT